MMIENGTSKNKLQWKVVLRRGFGTGLGFGMLGVVSFVLEEYVITRTSISAVLMLFLAVLSGIFWGYVLTKKGFFNALCISLISIPSFIASYIYPCRAIIKAYNDSLPEHEQLAYYNYSAIGLYMMMYIFVVIFTLGVTVAMIVIWWWIKRYMSKRKGTNL